MGEQLISERKQSGKKSSTFKNPINSVVLFNKVFLSILLEIVLFLTEPERIKINRVKIKIKFIFIYCTKPIEG